mgnify:CR=1 FL=1
MIEPDHDNGELVGWNRQIAIDHAGRCAQGIMQELYGGMLNRGSVILIWRKVALRIAETIAHYTGHELEESERWDIRYSAPDYTDEEANAMHELDGLVVPRFNTEVEKVSRATPDDKRGS